MIKFECDIECSACKGTGIYKGYSEHDGAGVICTKCNGTGMVHINYEFKEFTGRNIREDINRVYETSGGFVITDQDVTTSEGRDIKFSESGVSYKDWLNGEEPKPIRDLHCPLLHFNQGSDEGKAFKKCDKMCESKLDWGDLISNCAKKHRDKCWKLYDSGVWK